MGLLDNLNFENLNPYQTGLLGSLGSNDLVSILQAFGGYRPPQSPDAPQIPVDPSGSAPMGSAPPNPYGNPSAIMPSFTSTIPAQDQQQAQGGPLLRPGSFLDKLLSRPQMAANAAATAGPSAPLMSGAEPSAAWTGPLPTQAPPQPRPPIASLPQMNGNAGMFGGPSLPQSAMGGGLGGGAFPSDNAQLPPNATPTNGSLPTRTAPPPQSPMMGIGNKLREMAGVLDPSQRATFGVIGKDLAGNEQYGWIDPISQTTRAAQLGAGSYPTDATGSPLQGADLLGHLQKTDPAAASMVQAIIRGDAAVTGRNLQKYLPIATLVDPSLQQFNYDARKKTAVDFSSGGASGRNVKSLETVGGHLEKMVDAFKGLNNSWSPEYNTFGNWLSQRAGQGSVNAFNTYANGVSNELGTVFRSVGMSDAEVKSWRDQIASSASPQQFSASMTSLLDMLQTRKEALAKQYSEGTGRDLPATTFAKLESAIEKVRKSVELPTGPSAQSAPMTATGPNGQRVILQNGQWVPMR